MSDGWHNIEQQRDSNGNPTAVAKAIQAIIDNGCDCDERDGECGGECSPGLCEAAIHEQFDEIARPRASLAPREPSPELARAEEWLRSAAKQQHGQTPGILEELERLRAEVARLSQPASDAPFSEQVKEWLAQNGIDKPDEANGRYIHASYLTRLARNADYKIAALSKPAPAQDRATRVEVRTLGDAWDDGVEAACEWFDVGASAPRLDSLYKENPYRTAERAGKDGTGT